MAAPSVDDLGFAAHLAATSGMELDQARREDVEAWIAIRRSRPGRRPPHVPAAWSTAWHAMRQASWADWAGGGWSVGGSSPIWRAGTRSVCSVLTCPPKPAAV